MQGVIDQVRIFSRALTHDEVQSLYSKCYILIYYTNSDIFDIVRGDSISVKTMYASTQRELFELYSSLLYDYDNGNRDEFYCPESSLQSVAKEFGLSMTIFLDVLRFSIKYYEANFPEKFI